MIKGLSIFILTFFLTISIFIYKPYKLYAQTDVDNPTPTDADNLNPIERLEQYQNANCFIDQPCCVFGADDPVQVPDYSSGAPFPIDKMIDLAEGVGNFFLNITVNPIKSAFFSFFRRIFGIGETYCLTGEPSSNERGNCRCIGRNELLSMFCNNIGDQGERTDCADCVNIQAGNRNGGGVWTAIGCVTGDLNKFIRKKVFGFGVGLAGVIALFCIIYAAFQLQTSQGSPEKIKKAQELLTSCIMGLMLIIFSVFILKLIGVDILKIPSFR